MGFSGALLALDALRSEDGADAPADGDALDDFDAAAAVADVGEGDTAVALAEVRFGEELRLLLLPERGLTRLRSCELTTSSGIALRGGGRVDHSSETETGVRSRSSIRYGWCWLFNARGRAFGLCRPGVDDEASAEDEVDTAIATVAGDAVVERGCDGAGLIASGNGGPSLGREAAAGI